MKVIHKQRLSLLPNEEVRLPGFREFLSVDVDPNRNICIWYEADTEDIKNGVGSKTTITIIGTGIEVPEIPSEFLGTVVAGSFVWHFYHCNPEEYSE